jgi:phage repressor protein C with HTH and peptisase S24 domain
VKRPRIQTQNDGLPERTMKLSPQPDRPTGVPGSAGADKQAFVNRLQAILAHWPSADRLARAMGVSPSAFRKWLKGEAEPSRERLVALARVAGVSIAWLAQGEGPAPNLETISGASNRLPNQKPSAAVDTAQFILLPKQSDSIGEPVQPAPPMLGFLALRHDWVRAACGVEPENLQLEIAAGDAMGPTIRHGDAMLIDTADQTLRSVGVYVLQVNDQRLVKRVQRRHDGSLVLISDNGVYQPDVVDPTTAAGIVVVGRVVWAGGVV